MENAVLTRGLLSTRSVLREGQARPRPRTNLPKKSLSTTLGMHPFILLHLPHESPSPSTRACMHILPLLSPSLFLLLVQYGYTATLDSIPGVDAVRGARPGGRCKSEVAAESSYGIYSDCMFGSKVVGLDARAASPGGESDAVTSESRRLVKLAHIIQLVQNSFHLGCAHPLVIQGLPHGTRSCTRTKIGQSFRTHL